MTDAFALSLPPDLMPDLVQRQASDPGTSAWVNASAGSGKTTVLTNRVTRLLLEGVAPEKILCLTFTRAGAAEMANRVTRQLANWATCSDDDLRKDLDALQGVSPTPEQLPAARRLFARVLGCAGGIRIRTIHAFCQEILRRFPIEADLSPHFAVIEEGEASALQERVLKELLHDAAAAPAESSHQALAHLVQNLGEAGFAEAVRGILAERARLTESVTRAGGLQNLIGALRSELALGSSETVDGIVALASDPALHPHEALNAAAQALLKGLETCHEFGAGILKYLTMPTQQRKTAFIEYKNLFFTEAGTLRKKLTDKKTVAALPEAEEILLREGARLQKVAELLELVQLAENTEAILVFGDALIQRYEDKKAAQAVLDYDDLIIRTDRLLRRPGLAPWILYKLDGGLDHILVDEAQDTSRAQWRIVAALADEFFAGSAARAEKSRTLFVVGDEKQSIFSFQRADPEAFAEMRSYFQQRIGAAKKKYGEMPMHASFRSAPAILQAVDHVFISDRARSGVSVEPVVHRAFKTDKKGRVEVWPLMPAPEKEGDERGAWVLPLGYETEQDTQVELARSIANKIRGWLSRGDCLPGTTSAITAGVIMILLRRRGRFADLMVRALKATEVPVTGVDRMLLITQLPVMDLLALMQFALLPEDDLNLAVVLRGPLVGLGEEQLMELAIGRKDSLWHSLIGKASHRPDYQAVHAYLAVWLNQADFLSPFAMLMRFLNETCPANAVSGRRAIWSRLGPDALDPIDELLNVAQSFSQRHAPSLQAFLHWLMATETEIKREMDRGGGQVRIMTVHAAKGLEAPIVFLPDTASVPRTQDVPRFLWSEHGTPFYTVRKPSFGLPLNLWNHARRKQLEEYRRLLYVALTRAANELYVCGWESAKNDANADESWYNLILGALKPLHDAQKVHDVEPRPRIAFADDDMGGIEKKMVTGRTVEKIRLPQWALQPAAIQGRAPTIAPSRIGAPATATPDAHFVRGRIIHRLLQSLPDLSRAQQENATSRFLANPQHGLTTEEQDNIKAEVLSVLRHPKYRLLFGSGSRAEVQLAGQVGGHFISGRLDRLCVREDGVWIVDYKTNRPPPERPEDVPEPYRLQLAQYRAVLQKIYPKKPIFCYLLWTYGGRLMEIPAHLLAA